MIRLLTFLGKKSSIILILGLILAVLLPSVSSALRPTLPFLVSLLLGLAIARLNISEVLREFVNTRKVLLMLLIVLILMPLSTIVLVSIWRLFDLDINSELLLVVFAAAPPLSSATSFSLLLGYNSRITLQVTLLATLLTPVLGPLCFKIIGVSTNIELFSMMLGIALMILGGFFIGVCLQAILGKDMIDRFPDAFNGAFVIVIVLFLFPLFDGVANYVLAEPILAAVVMLLAVVLNLGGNIIVRLLGRQFTDVNTANALGLMFGNRNLSMYLVVLPFNPLLSLFIAASQFPMYSTPALFARDKKESN